MEYFFKIPWTKGQTWTNRQGQGQGYLLPPYAQLLIHRWPIFLIFNDFEGLSMICDDF